VYVGQNDIFDSLSNIRKKLKGDRPREKIVHVVEKLHCRANGDTGVAIRVSGSFIVGNQFLVCGEGIKPEGMPSLDELSIDIPSKRVGQFREQFIMQPGNLMSSSSCIMAVEIFLLNSGFLTSCTMCFSHTPALTKSRWARLLASRLD
jgi:hypothetical protein